MVCCHQFDDRARRFRGRIDLLDQFRGYTDAGSYTYCSYADTILPQFFFTVGFAYRLTSLRRDATLGTRPAAVTVIRSTSG